MKYGIYDTKHNLWMGNAKGPLLFDDDGTCPGGQWEAGHAEELAALAARVMDVQLGQPAGRSRERVFPGGLVLRKDYVTVQHTPVEALMLLEEGKVL